MVIEASAQKPGLEERLNHGSPHSRIVIGPPMAFGSTLLHRARELAQGLVIVGIAFRQNFHLVATVLRHPLARDLARQRFERDRLRLQIVAQLVERGVERRDHRGVRPCRAALRRLGELGKVVGKTLGGDGAAPCLRAGGLLQSLDRGLERGDIVGIGRRLLVRVGLQHRIEHGRELADGGKLGLLIVGNEALDGLDPGDLRQLAELLHVGPRRLLVRRQHEDRVRADGGIAFELEEGCNRFDLGASQIERIEVELQPIEQRQPGGDDEPGADDDRDPVPLHEPIDGRKRLVSHLCRLTRRTQQRQQCRDQRDAREERDDHPETGKQSELATDLCSRWAGTTESRPRSRPRRG